MEPVNTDNEAPIIQQPTTPPVIENKSFFSNVNPRENLKGFLIVFFAFIVALGLLSVGGYAATQKRTKTEDKKVTKVPFKAVANNSIVYGYWGPDKSVIHAADLNSGNIFELATLPSSIKQVTVVGKDKLYFINDTVEARDKGKEIAMYDQTTQKITSLVSASDGYLIDQYVLSPNQRYLATWESFVPEGDIQLIKGVSRVYAVDLQNPGTKNLIYSENAADGPVHYPIGITDEGKLFMDRFQANTTSGWGRGMSVSDITGAEKQEIPSMAAGTYSSQPVMTTDGKYLVFAGYNGSLGPGAQEVAGKDNFTQASLNPNTVSYLDTATLDRTTYPFSDQNRYPSVQWDSVSNQIIYTVVSVKDAENGTFLVSIGGTTPTQVKTGILPNAKNTGVVSTLTGTKLLNAVKTDSPSQVGNLGPNYAQMITQMSVFDWQTNKKIPLNVGPSQIQFISIFPSGFFNGGKIAGEVQVATNSEETLQLQTFTIKPVIATRTEQQSAPRCRDLAAQQCNSMLGTNFTGDQARSNSSGDKNFDDCFQSQFDNALGKSVCFDSPLYLYGAEGTVVKVGIGTEIYDSNAPYNDGYSGILNGKGGIEVAGTAYDSIDFNYIPGLKLLKQPSYGRSVKGDQVKSVVAEYGKKLGLNEVEIKDLQNSIVKITSPYVFVSFYDDKTSKAILPMAFSPVPDVYRNVVFYLKPQNSPTASVEPRFNDYPSRVGFTAVEVSYFIAQ